MEMVLFESPKPLIDEVQRFWQALIQGWWRGLWLRPFMHLALIEPPKLLIEIFRDFGKPSF